LAALEVALAGDSAGAAASLAGAGCAEFDPGDDALVPSADAGLASEAASGAAAEPVGAPAASAADGIPEAGNFSATPGSGSSRGRAGSGSPA